MKLGPLELETDLMLAPLMDVMTPSFRQLIRHFGGVGFIVTPMVFVQQFAMAPKTVAPHLETIEKERPCAVQIVASGKNDDNVRIALEFLDTYKFDVIDINAGCPARHTMKSGGGGNLIRDLNDGRLQKIIEMTHKFSSKPVSVKTRLGYENDTSIFDTAKLVERLGVIYLTIHGRTVKQEYQGTVNLDRIREVKAQLSIPVVGNGDIIDYATYNRMKTETHCDAVMIGRQAMGDPSLFSRIWKQELAIREGSTPNLNLNQYIPQLEEVREHLRFVERTIDGLSSYWNNDRFRFAELRRLSIWFIKGMPGHKKARVYLSKMQEVKELRNFMYGTEIEKLLLPES
jgi:tRNA-dihydrouridine synthase B